MQVQQAGIEVAGHNMANVNNPAYARQRIAIQTTSPIKTEHGLEGTGATASHITQIRDLLLDAQIVSEDSVSGSLDAQQRGLQYAQANLSQTIDRAAGAAGANAQLGIGDSISGLFSAFQSLSTQPSSLTERDVVLTRANELAERFRLTDSRLDHLRQSLNTDVEGDVTKVNDILKDIARLNEQIGTAETLSNGVANDIRDTRQAKLEELARYVKFDTLSNNAGAVDITISGVTMVDGVGVRETLEAYETPDGKMMVRTASTDSDMDILGGSLHGAIEARDGAVQKLRDNLNALAASLISEINKVHRTGFGKDGTTGYDLFEGAGAADIRVNQALVADPAKLHVSDTSGNVGNNGIALALARLEKTPQAALGNQTFSQSYARTVATLGESLSSVNEQIADQTVVTNMLSQQRDSLSAVSLDEEMTDLIKYQKAYQASAQVINIVNEMLDTVINIAR